MGAAIFIYLQVQVHLVPSSLGYWPNFVNVKRNALNVAWSQRHKNWQHCLWLAPVIHLSEGTLGMIWPIPGTYLASVCDWVLGLGWSDWLIEYFGVFWLVTDFSESLYKWETGSELGCSPWIILLAFLIKVCCSVKMNFVLIFKVV